MLWLKIVFEKFVITYLHLTQIVYFFTLPNYKFPYCAKLNIHLNFSK